MVYQIGIKQYLVTNEYEILTISGLLRPGSVDGFAWAVDVMSHDTLPMITNSCNHFDGFAESVTMRQHQERGEGGWRQPSA